MQSEKTYSVLLVSSNEKLNASLMSFMPREEYSPVETCESVSSARRLFAERNFDIVIVNSPVKDEPGINFAVDIATDSSCGVLLLVPADFWEEICAKVQDYGVFCVPKPVTTQVIRHSLKMLCSTRERLMRMEIREKSFEEKLQEIKNVNRAKLLLMENESLSEEEAHKFIEKTAMDKRATRDQIARALIDKYAKK
ncbi:MAG: ANTAR domain-containing protein [Clostridiales bacterium]|nr:ANTAR domain-containing protein [Clostridiales bacterium]